LFSCKRDYQVYKKAQGIFNYFAKKVIHNFHFLLDMAREVLTLGKRFLHFLLDMAREVLTLGKRFIHFFLDNIRGIW